MTSLERADIFFMTLTGMTTDELARKIVKDYNDELRANKDLSKPICEQNIKNH